MAGYNPNDYETVDQRIRRFYRDHPNARITTELVDVAGEVGKTRWTVKASVWRDRIDGAPDSTGYAFEIDGAGGANRTSALENCETSSIGRALANLNYSGNLRATREEMAKTQREQQSKVNSEQVIAAAQSANTKGDVRAVWNTARSEGAPQDVLDQVAAIAKDKPDE